MRRTASLIGIVVLFPGFARPIAREVGTENADQTRAMSAPHSPVQLARRYTHLFAGVTDDRVRRLATHVDSGVALAAGWELVRRTLPPDKHPMNVPVSRDFLVGFLKLVEARTQLEVPRRWEAIVQSARAHGRNNIWFPTPEDLKLGDRTTEDERETQVVKVALGRDPCAVTVRDRTWILALPPSMRRVEKASVKLTKATVYVAIYGSRPVPYALYAVDHHTHNVKWLSRVWGSGGLITYLGYGWHEVELRIHHDKLFVFGVSDDAVYIEVFDVDTGRNLYRFSDAYFEPEIR